MSTPTRPQPPGGRPPQGARGSPRTEGPAGTQPSSVVSELIQRFNNCGKLSELNPQTEDFIRKSEELAQSRDMGRLNPTQLRRVFHEFRTIVKDYRRATAMRDAQFRLVMLRPKLAYAAGRGVMPAHFYKLICAALEKVRDADDIEFLDRFLTAFLAYFKYHTAVSSGGRQGGAQ